MTTDVQAPVSGRVLSLADTPDPVFADELVGSGLAVDPQDDHVDAVAPISGRLVKVMPHAYVISGDDGAVLVHLGIDTVKLEGSGFDVAVTEGDPVEAGDVVVTWSPAAVREAGLSALVLVCALDTPPRLVDSASAPASVASGEGLFSLPLGG